MNTPIDRSLDGLVARLRELTGHDWQRRDAWDVAVTIMIGGQSWSYARMVNLAALYADPAGYAQMVVDDLNARRGKWA